MTAHFSRGGARSLAEFCLVEFLSIVEIHKSFWRVNLDFVIFTTAAAGALKFIHNLMVLHRKRLTTAE
jgi:hypothetical protein